MRCLWRFAIHIPGERTIVRYAFGESGLMAVREEIIIEFSGKGARVAIDYYRKGRWRGFDSIYLQEALTWPGN